MTKQRFYQQIALVLAGAMGLAIIWEHALAGVISTWLWPAHASDGGIASWLDVIAFTAICGLALTALVNFNQPHLGGTQLEKGDLVRTRALLDTAVESFSDGFVYFDAEDKFVFCNRAYRDAHPLAAHMLTPGSDFTLIVRHLVDHGFYGNSEAEKASMIRTRMERHRSGDDFEYHTEDGRWFHMSQFKTQDGGTALVRTDVTKRKEAELAIRESEKLFRTVMNHLPVGVSIKDPQGRYQFTNDLYENWYGLGLNNLQGR